MNRGLWSALPFFLAPFVVAPLLQTGCSDDSGNTSPGLAPSPPAVTPTPSAPTPPFDAGVPEAGGNDAGDAAVSELDAGTPICTVATGKVIEQGPSSVYTVDVNLEGAAGSCILATSTKFEAPEAELQIGYTAGSSGYSINARADWEITATSPGTVVKGLIDVINATEGLVYTFTVKRRNVTSPSEDAGASPPGPFEIKVRMNPDPDFAKWTLSLYAFGPK